MTETPDNDEGRDRDKASERVENVDLSPEELEYYDLYVELSPEELEYYDLYVRNRRTYQQVPTLARRWLKELGKKGLSSDWQKQSGTSDIYPETDQLYPETDQLSSARLDNGQTVSLWFHPGGISVLDEPLRTDLAILGTLAALEAREADVDVIRRTLALNNASVKDILLQKFDWQSGRNESRLMWFASVLLRYYRSDVDEMPIDKQQELLVRTCERLDEVCKAERKLAEHLEYGTGASGERSAAR